MRRIQKNDLCKQVFFSFSHKEDDNFGQFFAIKKKRGIDFKKERCYNKYATLFNCIFSHTDAFSSVEACCFSRNNFPCGSWVESHRANGMFLRVSFPSETAPFFLRSRKRSRDCFLNFMKSGKRSYSASIARFAPPFSFRGISSGLPSTAIRFSLSVTKTKGLINALVSIQKPPTLPHFYIV